MVLLAVNGTLMRGLELNPNLLEVGAAFVCEAKTSAEYRLYSVRDVHPGMVRVAGGDDSGAAIALEIWDISPDGLASVLSKEPAGLCIGKVCVVRCTASISAGVADAPPAPPAAAEEVLGVLAEPWVVEGMRDITSFGGWRSYMESKAAQASALKTESGTNSTDDGAAAAPVTPAAALETLQRPPVQLQWLQEGLGSGPGAGSVKAVPYNWPFDGSLRKHNTALIIIDMQVDFCGKGGYVDQMGYDLSLTQAPIRPIKRLLDACRRAGLLVIHTREGHRPDLSDLPANKKWRSEQIGAGIGSKGPAGRVLVRGEKGWDIIPELYPNEGEPIIEKPGKGSFYSTDLDMILQLRGIRNVVLTGITTDVCVHTTMRDANDRGYECVILADCTGATDVGNHAAALKMVTMQGGVFGAVSTSECVISALESIRNQDT